MKKISNLLMILLVGILSIISFSGCKKPNTTDSYNNTIIPSTGVNLIVYNKALMGGGALI